MNHSDIRKHLKRCELASTVLETLGYTYVDNQREHPHWVAPENPMDPVLKGIEALIAEQVAAQVKAAQEVDPRGPNWHLVEGQIGKNFQVRESHIPSWHDLSKFGSHHYLGKAFRCDQLKYVRDDQYTGYMVQFQFATRPYRPESVWLPLSACVFRT